jgi:hypothetical protein
MNSHPGNPIEGCFAVVHDNRMDRELESRIRQRAHSFYMTAWRQGHRAHGDCREAQDEALSQNARNDAIGLVF